MLREARCLIAWVVLALCVAGYSAQARPGQGINVGKLKLTPHVSLSGTYDSNVFLEEVDKDADLFWQLQCGLDAVISGDQYTLDIVGVSYTRKFSDTDPEEDGQISGGLSARLAVGRLEKVRITLAPSWERIEDYSLRPRTIDPLNAEGQAHLVAEDSTERSRRDLTQVSLNVERAFSKTSANVSYGFSHANYDAENLNDSSENKIGGGVDYQVTDKSAILAEYYYGVQESDGFRDNLTFHILRGGWRTLVTEKTSFKAAIGAEQHDDGTDNATGEDALQTIMSFDLAGYWRATEKMLVQVTGHNSIEPSSLDENNTKTMYVAAAGAQYRLSRDVSCSAGVSTRTDRYRRKVLEAGKSREMEAFGVKAGVNYVPVNKFYSLHLSASHELNDSNFEGEDYDQTRVSLNLNLKY